MPVPLRRLFDYHWAGPLSPGTRVLVPFGKRRLVGVVLSSEPGESERKLRSILEVLDPEVPALSGPVLDMLRWVADYQHHPPGEALATGLPILLRQDNPLAPPRGVPRYRACPNPDPEQVTALSRAPRQQALFNCFDDLHWHTWDVLAERSGCGRHVLNALVERGFVESGEGLPSAGPLPADGAIRLSPEQDEAAGQVISSLGTFSSFLLQGITGSGKTEVYLAAARECIARGGQVLFLVPEISLTPQLVARVRRVLGDGVRSLHSGMTDRERYETWWLAREGRIAAVLGTRSAVFTPLKNPGLIVVDEEHDASYKQQDGLRYHARNLAIKRASLEGVPVVLGSATPSLESLRNVHAGRHRLLTLHQRHGAARLPAIRIVDTGIHPPVNGLSAPALDAIAERLDRGEQVIVYVNRRGYAPVVHCYQCGWQAVCEHCAARLVYHKRREQFRCHHCGRVEPADPRCPQCDTTLFLGGAGTQRLEQALLGRFPAARLCRLDRDEANTPRKLYRKLEQIRDGEVDIVIGTQLITKGHDFGRVSLVCVVSADQGLYSVDFRGPEALFQQLLQVAGRAGRADLPGEVLVQTAHPDHPCIRLLAAHDYSAFAARELTQREQAEYPPFAHFVLFRAEAVDPRAALDFLGKAERLGLTLQRTEGIDDVEILPPVPSPMEKLAGRFRFQMLVRSAHRGSLHRLLSDWARAVESERAGKDVRWSLDIDPMDML